MNRLHVTSLLALSAASLLVGVSVRGVHAADTASAQSIERYPAPNALETPVRILARPDGHFDVGINGRVVSWESLANRAGVSLDGCGMWVRGNGQLTVQSLARSLQITFEHFPNAALTLPALHYVVLTPHLDRKIVDIEAPSQNAAPLHLSLPDHGAADLPPNAKLRFDLFADGGYFIAGSNNALGQTAEGRMAYLSTNSPALTGGPLVLNPATGKYKRATPFSSLTLSGSWENGIVADFDGASTQIPFGGIKELSAPNGTKIQIQHRADLSMVQWTVIKGLVRIQIAAVSGWTCVAPSGASARVQWIEKTRVIQFQNLQSDYPVQVELSSQLRAIIPTAGQFRFNPINSFVFLADGSGNINIAQDQTGQTYPLDGTMRFVGGQWMSRSSFKAGNLRQPLVLTWDRGVPLQVNSQGNNASVRPGNNDIFQAADNGRVAVNYASDGSVEVSALQGSYEVRMAALNGMAIKLDEGNTITLRLNLEQSSFSVKASEFNEGTLDVTPVGGQSRQSLPPDRFLRFDINKDGSVVTTTSNGKVVAYQPAGLEAIASGTSETAPVVVRPQDDPTRIAQTTATEVSGQVQ